MPPRTIVANQTSPSNVLSFALPPGVTIDVESVLAAIDNTAGGDTGALLEIADSSGAVIARKRQTELVTAGQNPGSATWALRLADDGGSAGVAKWGLYRGTINTAVPGETNFVWQGNLAAGQELFSYGNGADSPSPLVSGLYAISATIIPALAPVPPAPDYFIVSLLKTTPPVFSSGNQAQREAAPFVTLPLASAEPTWPLTPADFFTLQLWQNAVVPLVWGVAALAALIEGIP